MWIYFFAGNDYSFVGWVFVFIRCFRIKKGCFRVYVKTVIIWLLGQGWVFIWFYFFSVFCCRLCMVFVCFCSGDQVLVLYGIGRLIVRVLSCWFVRDGALVCLFLGFYSQRNFLFGFFIGFCCSRLYCRSAFCVREDEFFGDWDRRILGRVVFFLIMLIF